MTTLLIVESPTKAKTIGKYLGRDFSVKASVGHIRDLPTSNKDAIDFDNGFKPKYVIPPTKRKVISDIVAIAMKADRILIATDPDREGEAIAWHLKTILQDKKVDAPIKRVRFFEVTKEAVFDAVNNPTEIDEDLRKAQEARRVLDRIVGYDLSGMIWKKVRYGLSAGRVQSPALRILMEREREIRAFIPEGYVEIFTDTLTQKGEGIRLQYDADLKTLPEARLVEKALTEEPLLVAGVTEKEAKRSPKPPFTTSTLQQSAATRLGFSPSRTMKAAQKLYEAGHITYMRTDSVSLSGQALGTLGGAVEEIFGKALHSRRQFKTSSKNAQEAHEAIRPTNPRARKAGNNPDEEKLYSLVWTRAMASQMVEAQVLTTTLEAKANDYRFVARGIRVVKEGWLMADPKARTEDVELPKVQTGEKLEVTNIDVLEKETQPPGRYTEAGLIKELEKRGIGRPSTYASIMKTIVDRGYVTKEGRTLTPTIVGDLVSSFLEEHFPQYVSDTFTAQMEDELDDIARGERTYESTLAAFYSPFQKELKAKNDVPKVTTLGAVPKEFLCPICHKDMVYKLGKGGVFMSCSTFPECKGARAEDGTIMEDTIIGIHPESGKQIFLLQGPYGMYLQEGEKVKGKKLRRASLPKEKSPETVTLEDAVLLLALPRTLGKHPDTNKEVTAAIGKYGPYVGCDGEFRSLKEGDDPYTVTLERALELLKEEKKGRSRQSALRVLGQNPTTNKDITLYAMGSRYFVRKGIIPVYFPEGTGEDTITLELALSAIQAYKKK